MIETLEKSLNYTFRNKDLLRNALIHKSYNEGLMEEAVNNEKMEFLGDSVINLIITEYLFKRLSHLSEGELSKIKAHLVSSNFLFEVAKSINLGDFILLGKGEEKNDGRNNRKIISSLFEAVVGAIYLDSNFKIVAAVVAYFFEEFLATIIEKEIKINDYKSELQEVVQKHRNARPQYEIVNESGKPPHIIFVAKVSLDEVEIGRGSGRSKRQAEQQAAMYALKKFDNLSDFEELSDVFFSKNE